MKLVVDSNILFTFFWKKSITKELFLKQDLELFSPEFSLEEIKKYTHEIMRKTKLSRQEFNDTRKKLANYINFIPIKDYQSHFTQALHITPDPNDIDFFALALKLHSPIWSNDKELQKQETVKIISTHDLLKII